MLRKLSAVLAVALAASAAPGARADEAPAGEEAPASEEKPAEPEASEEAADASEAGTDDEAEAEESPYDRDGFYAGIGGGGTIEFFQHGSSGDSGYVQARAGYHFLQFAALEFQVEYTPKFKGKSGDYDGVNTGIFATWFNLKGYPTAPWTGPIQPFAMIGLGWGWERRWGSALNGVDHNGAFVSRFGAGVDFYVTENIVVTAESAYVVPAGSLSSLDQLQIGGALSYRFGP